MSRDCCLVCVSRVGLTVDLDIHLFLYIFVSGTTLLRLVLGDQKHVRVDLGTS